MLLASATSMILITFGVAIVAIVVGCGAIFLTFGGDDRELARRLVRHPLRTIFREDEPDADDL